MLLILGPSSSCSARMSDRSLFFFSSGVTVLVVLPVPYPESWGLRREYVVESDFASVWEVLK